MADSFLCIFYSPREVARRKISRSDIWLRRHAVAAAETTPWQAELICWKIGADVGAARPYIYIYASLREGLSNRGIIDNQVIATYLWRD